MDYYCKQYAQTDKKYSQQFSTQQTEAWLQTSRALVLEKEKAIFCFIPKVGCSSWKVKILENRGLLSKDDYKGLDAISHEQPMQDILAKYGIRTLSEYDLTTAKWMLKSYYKFLFVRDPFERLLSAYRDKMANPGNQHYRPKANNILKFFRSNLTVPTFTMFLKSLVHTPPRMYDIHWRPYDVMCNPCHVNYDVIGKLETLESDVGCVTSQLNMTSWFPLPGSARSTFDLVGAYFRSVPETVMADVEKAYGHDAAMFGYKSLLDRGYRTQGHITNEQKNTDGHPWPLSSMVENMA